MQKPEATEYASNFSGYINLVLEEPLLDVLNLQVQGINDLLANSNEQQADYRYAPGKWSLKQVIGHMTDTERIMSYRLLRIARGDTTPLPGFDENLFIEGANFEARTLADLLAEMKCVREATLWLFKGLKEEAWSRQGTASNHSITARSLAYVIAGHWQHHRNVIEERYIQA